MARIASAPSCIDENENERKARAAGAGCRRSRAAVMTPSTPSLPVRMGVRSGPCTRRSKRTTSPRPTTHSSEATMSSILP